MNKVVNVNLGAVPFIIDENAFEHLSKYMELLKIHFKHMEGSEEILSDIESRLGELFTEYLGTRQIVEITDVKKAIGVMGTPEDLGAEEEWEEITDNSKERQEEGDYNNQKRKYQTGKRLFRDKENSIISGTCSGIAAYFGVADPVWVRIGFVLAGLASAGSAILVYLIIWAITPAAKSAKDRLMMRGEKIDVDAISRKVKEEFDNVEKQFNQFSDSFKKKR